jgi:flagellar hook-length control protein FliK
MMGSAAILLAAVQGKALQAAQGGNAESAQGEDFLAALGAALPMSTDTPAVLPTPLAQVLAAKQSPATDAEESATPVDMASVLASLLQAAATSPPEVPPDAQPEPSEASTMSPASSSPATNTESRQLAMLLAKDASPAPATTPPPDATDAVAGDVEPQVPAALGEAALPASSPSPQTDGTTALASPQALRQLLQMMSPQRTVAAPRSAKDAGGYTDMQATPGNLGTRPMEAAPAAQLASEVDAAIVATQDTAASTTPAAGDGLPDAQVSNLASPAQSAPQFRTADAPSPQVLHSPVGTPRWADELGSRITLMSLRGQHEGSLNLTPEHLGPLEVRISVNQDTANVWFGSQHADTRAALADALPRLRELLADAGMTLGQANVSQQAPRQGARENAPARGTGPSLDASGVETTVAPAARRVALGLVDTYA